MIISAAASQSFKQGGVTATGYAAPSRGSAEISLWRLHLVADEVSPQHVLTNEEVFLILAGSGSATIEDVTEAFAAGDCLVAPAGKPFALAAGRQGLEAVCAMRAGGRATILPDGPTITPPWAA